MSALSIMIITATVAVVKVGVVGRYFRVVSIPSETKHIALGLAEHDDVTIWKRTSGDECGSWQHQFRGLTVMRSAGQNDQRALVLFAH